MRTNENPPQIVDHFALDLRTKKAPQYQGSNFGVEVSNFARRRVDRKTNAVSRAGQGTKNTLTFWLLIDRGLHNGKNTFMYFHI